MAVVRFLGGAGFDPGAGPHQGPAVQRRRLALLGVLAAHAPRAVSRDRLIAWFWPEEPTPRARHFLADSVYVLRQALGRTAIQAVGDDLVLNGDVVWADVAAFREAVRRGDHAQSVELYGGPFLDGVFIHDAPDFERWVEAERERLAGEYARAVESLALACQSRGDWAGAARWWRVLTIHDPYDAHSAVGLEQALIAVGDHWSAVRHARTYTATLRREFDTEPPETIRQLALGLTDEREGIAQARDPGDTARARLDDAPPVGPSEREAPLSLVPLAGAGLALLALLSLRPRAAPSTAEPSVAVLPLEDRSSDASIHRLGDGMTDGLIAELGRLEPLRVVSRSSAMRYRGTTKPVQQIGRELGVAYVVEGTVARVGDSAFVAVYLIDAQSDRHAWTGRYGRAMHDVAALQRHIARDVARALRVRPTGTQVVRAAGRIDPAAYELYLVGREAQSRSRDGLERAVVLYRQAIERDPAFAAAHAGLADAYVLLGHFGFLPAHAAFPRGRAAARRAIALDSLNAEAHAALGLALAWERDWLGAETALREALVLRPGYATGHQWYALLLAALGRSDEAVAHAAHASELDPLSLQASNTYGLMLYYAGDSAAALRQFRRLVVMEPDTGWVGESPWLLANATRVYVANGLYEEASATLARAVAANPQHPRPLWERAYLQVRMGRRADAFSAIDQAARTDRQYGYYRACVHAALGQPDSAFAWFDRVEEWIPAAMSDLRMDPRLAPLRTDPRYARLLARLGLI